TPFNCTAKDEWLKAEDYEMTFNYQTTDNNRSVRSHYLFEQKDKISFQDFKDIKYDVKYHTPLPAPAIDGLEVMFHLDEMKYPKIAESIRLLKAWDREAKIDRKAAVASLTISSIIKEMMEAGLFPGENTVSEEFVVKHITKAQKRLEKHFGKVDVTLGELQRIHRGDKDYPVGGMPDVLAAMNFEDGKKGRLKAFLGDSFFQFVSYNKDGSMKLETINAFGASAREDSPHFDDQLDMYLNQKTKEVSLDKREVEKTAKRTYHPGE
ncbi:MAG: penicillin acylase family protein, partial [Saprospiraceae bacterium]